MVQSLPGFLNLSLNVCSLCQVLGDVYTEVLEATHPLHRGPTDHKRGVGPLLSLPEVHDQLFPIKTIDNPWVNCTLTVWKSIITEYKLTEEIVPLKWCAYDSEFTPNRLDTRFKDWIDKGITVLCNLIEDNILASFELLKEKHSLDTQDFYRYLQMRHFVNIKMKNMAETRTGFI